MATTRAKFLTSCQKVVDAKPDYKNGASGLKECDCIGMIKYGLRDNGVTISTTGTNWTFRNQVTNIRKISGVSDLRVGDVVFKALDPGDKNYNLPGKYREGGKNYNGDLKDYNHIGAVKSLNPLQIIHMTGPTAKTDNAIGKWKYAADLKSQYISDSGSSSSTSGSTSGGGGSKPAETPATSSGMTATVYAEKGGTVFLRQKASQSCRTWIRVPVGTQVTVTTYKGDWCTVNYGSKKGWFMMTKFLKFD